MKIFLQIISGLLTTSFLFAQENIKIDALRFYGKLRVHSFLFDNNIELNINSIRSVNKRGFSQKNIYFNDNYTLMRYALGLNYHMNSNVIISSSARIEDFNLVNSAKDYNAFLPRFSFNFSYFTKTNKYQNT